MIGQGGPPEDPVCIAFDKGRDAAEKEIKHLCQRILPGWAAVAPEDMKITNISGGISNLLVKVTPLGDLPPVAVKVFGDKTELLIDREAEKRTLLLLNQQGFGAQVVGLFGNGRIEAFLEATTLTPDQMADPRFVPHIARRLRAFHDLPISHAPASGNMDINTTSSTTAATGGPHPDADPASAEAGQGPAVPAAAAGGAAGAAAAAAGGTGWESQWDAIMGWLDMAQGLSFPHDAAKQAQYDKVDFGAMRRELVELRALCERVGSPLVFCHNDLLSGNILIVQQQGRGPRGQEQQGQQAQEQQGQQDREQGQGGGKDGVGQEGQEAEGREVKRRRGNGEGDGGGAEEGDGAAEAAEQAERELGGRLQFIDFEYSCRGYRGFDLGNHFNEYAGFDCVYDRFPTPEQQKAFLRHYLGPRNLERLAAEELQRRRAGADSGKQEQEGLPQQGEEGQQQGDQQQQQQQCEEVVLDRTVAEACIFALASHAYWGVWSFIQARYSPIDFDYLSYSGLRWAEYHRRKPEFVALVDQHFPLKQA